MFDSLIFCRFSALIFAFWVKLLWYVALKYWLDQTLIFPQNVMNQHTVVNKRTFCLQQPKYIDHTSGQSKRHNLFDRKFLPVIENHFKVNVTNFPCKGFYQDVVCMSVSEADQVSNHRIVSKRSREHRFCIVSNFRGGESKPEKLV